MKIKIRNKRIKSSKLQIKELAKKYNLSYERIRQIRLAKKETHSKVKSEYEKRVKQIVRRGLLKEIERLTGKGRQRKIIIQKKILIKCLRDQYHFSFPQIGKLFKNDHTTIIHLYKNA